VELVDLVLLELQHLEMLVTELHLEVLLFQLQMEEAEDREDFLTPAQIFKELLEAMEIYLQVLV